jgi:hypothetical protein
MYEIKKRDNPHVARVSFPSSGGTAGLNTSDGLLGLGGTTDHSISLVGGFPFLIIGFSVSSSAWCNGGNIPMSQ